MGILGRRNRVAGIFRTIVERVGDSQMDCSLCSRYDMVFMALPFLFTEWHRSTNSVVFISCIIESYIYSCLMNITGNNIVSAMIYHFAWNLLIHIVALNPDHNNGSIFPYIILVILETLVLFIFWSVRKAN